VVIDFFLIPVVLFSFLSALSKKSKSTITWNWLGAVFVGFHFISVSSEFLGLLIILISSLTALLMVFVSLPFIDENNNQEKPLKKIIKPISSAFVFIVASLGLFFATVNGPALQSAELSTLSSFEIGKKLLVEHYAVWMVISLVAYLFLVGAGIVLRERRGD